MLLWHGIPKLGQGDSTTFGFQMRGQGLVQQHCALDSNFGLSYLSISPRAPKSHSGQNEKDRVSFFVTKVSFLETKPRSSRGMVVASAHVCLLPRLPHMPRVALLMGLQIQ